MKVIALDFFVSKIKSGIYRKGYTMPKFLPISQLQMEDRVIPMSTNPKEQGKTFTVTDLHPCNLNKANEYRTVAVTLWDCDPKEGRYGREHTSHTTMFQVIERYLDR